MYASYPHFYKADPFYLDQFEPGSVFPNQDLHESHMNIDSVSGVILDAKVRTQINVLLSPLNVTIEGGFSISVE
jgi:scavenger receptor class B protein 1